MKAGKANIRIDQEELNLLILALSQDCMSDEVGRVELLERLLLFDKSN